MYVAARKKTKLQEIRPMDHLLRLEDRMEHQHYVSSLFTLRQTYRPEIGGRHRHTEIRYGLRSNVNGLCIGDDTLLQRM